ncbi:hypothetical protein MNEG_1451 [Monoraphidium neglectum]|uniref:Uncharacterized protein n=1 Tax=Monoraphidium neglectum TaxID=145388 RepID=A0A0D2LJ84_9CHLO|nr:hypothetical protein MNEG_1451 [Monoraphidium neglectum]KIZ06504.1 hypothetical protein MNEG_1451 [Monoraphidium neglectum]|eukprot:XP_013905523.1 hypothetical protein MNEG_1451 [Monoraphidium neglectum]
MYISRFSDTMYDELLEKVDHVADKRALVFSNNFITTVGGTDNAVAVWRFLMAPMKHTEIQINGIKVLFTPPQQPVAANVSHLQDRGMLRLEMVSQQRWHLPTLLVLVRWVFGDVLSIHVTTTLTVDPDTGRLLHQQDVVNNWLTAPLVLRLLLGLSVPLATVLIKP